MAYLSSMLVSIVIPCYNVANYIGDAIKSVLSQDYAQVELLVVDNNSTDRTVEVIERLQLEFPGRIMLLKEPKRGAPVARNKGWRASKGDWIQFLDADDYLLSHKISRQLKLVTDKCVAVVGTPVYENLQGERTALEPWGDHWKGLAHGMFCGNTVANLYQREALEKLGGWQEKLPDTQDTHLMFELLKLEEEVVIDVVPACICRDRPEGKITQQDPKGILVRHFHLRKKMNSYLQKNKPEYWQLNYHFFELASYRFLRMLAIQDVILADQLFRKKMPVNFKVNSQRELKIPVWNACLVNIFGLRYAELIKRRIRLLLLGGK